MPVSRYICIFLNVGLREGSFGFRNLVTFTTAGVTSWTVPEELRKGRKCYVKVIGGGASGGIGSTTASAVTSYGSRLIVKNGARIKPGDKITEGSINPSGLSMPMPTNYGMPLPAI